MCAKALVSLVVLRFSNSLQGVWFNSIRGFPVFGAGNHAYVPHLRMFQ